MTPSKLAIETARKIDFLKHDDKVAEENELSETERIVDSALDTATAEKDLEIEKWKGNAEMLMTVVCNASEGDWNKQSKDWQVAAQRYVDEYCIMIKATLAAAEAGEKC